MHLSVYIFAHARPHAAWGTTLFKSVIWLDIANTKDTEEEQILQNAVQHTLWTTCASVNLELETGMALQIWMCLAHVRRQYRKIAGIRGAKS